MIYDCLNVLGRKTLHLGVIERVSFIHQKVESNNSGHFETIGKCIKPTLYNRVVVQLVPVKVAKL